MKNITCPWARLWCLALLLPALTSTAQTFCSPEAITAKYWQYRERFNKHFVMIDRKVDGCIGNGITGDARQNPSVYFAPNFTTHFGGNLPTCFAPNLPTCFGGNLPTRGHECQG
jgi:hypothetical protein